MTYLQVHEYLEKYIGRKTTTSTSVEEAASLPVGKFSLHKWVPYKLNRKLQLPYITVCAGFKPRVYNNVTHRMGYYFPSLMATADVDSHGGLSNITEEDVVDWFKENTYDLEESKHFWKAHAHYVGSNTHHAQPYLKSL